LRSSRQFGTRIYEWRGVNRKIEEEPAWMP